MGRLCAGGLASVSLTSVRFVAANVAASDTVKGSHIQRNPLSMGALAEPEEWPRVSQSPKEKKRRDCVMTARLTLSGMQHRKLAHSCEVGSYVVYMIVALAPSAVRDAAASLENCDITPRLSSSMSRTFLESSHRIRNEDTKLESSFGL